jgi:hypothetical protein
MRCDEMRSDGEMNRERAFMVRQRTELGVTARHHVGDLGEVLIADLTAQHTLLRSTGHAILL